MIGFRNNEGNSGTGINTSVQNNPNATKEDKCYCHILRVVTASVEVMHQPKTPTQSELRSTEVFINIGITASCEKEWSINKYPRTHHEKTTENGVTTDYYTFDNIKQTVCRDQECACPTASPYIPGATQTNSSTCVASLIRHYTSTKIGSGKTTGDSLPQWVAFMLIGGSPTHIEKLINWEEQLGGTGEDKLGFGPYDNAGHPKCSTAKAKGCCTSGDSFGVQT